MGAHRTLTLMAEIDLYLEAVEVFRGEGCEPRWRGEAGVLCAADREPAVQRRGRRGSSKPRKER
jgi:hypothetical protein